MIRFISGNKCQVLHRQSSNTTMVNAIEAITSIKESELVTWYDEVLNNSEYTGLDELVALVPTSWGIGKLEILVLISEEFSYYQGCYKKRKDASTTGLEAVDRMQSVCEAYLEALYEAIV